MQLSRSLSLSPPSSLLISLSFFSLCYLSSLLLILSSKNYKEGLISDDEKSRLKALVLADNNAKLSNMSSSLKQQHQHDPDLLDAGESVDLSTDLAQFMGSSPHLMWSLGSLVSKEKFVAED